MRKARKYHRPEDLVDPNYYGIGPKKEVKAALQSIEDRGWIILFLYMFLCIQ